MDAENVAKQFVAFYYQTFDADRRQLANLYRAPSTLTFESQATVGAEQIIQKLVDLPFQKVAHQVSTLDAQWAHDEGSILVLVTGVLLVDEEQRPMSYTQAFHLRPDGAGSFYVFNDVFRLVYPG
ncbi:nuclear transport factor 2 [Saccharata proteae CBS 121410]|uniref:Nuclear transport factor 2 n=1 Tax=Saccharata proteae CBS 121410 TaxID=1314787 RepID=A0A9P4HQC6_9PEZI|nr:nuclear transport factor 2 [Saccharata proteae CBS 121410]